MLLEAIPASDRGAPDRGAIDREVNPWESAAHRFDEAAETTEAR